MEQIINFENPAVYNTILVNPNKSFLKNTKITFAGKGNTLYVEDGVTINNSIISFNGNDAVCYLSSNRHKFFLNLNINNNSCIYVGKNCYINGVMTLITSEQQNIIIGNDGLFSSGIIIRTADPHLIYDCGTKQRINFSKSVLIGDHVWLGQNSFILKGTVIGSGTIIGGASVVSNKKLDSNIVMGGNPAKEIRRNVFFSGECVHSWTDEISEKYKVMNDNKWIFHETSDVIDICDIDTSIKEQKNSEKKLEKVIELLVNNESKDRFFIG